MGPRQTTPKPDRPIEPVVEEHNHEDMPFWDFRESIPGEPETDYPILDKIPQTAFTCNDRVDGYYADLETRCQVFHVCSQLPNGQALQSSFLCPNGTLFNQEVFSCIWWADVECATSDQFYNLNNNIGVVPESSASSSNALSTGSGVRVSASASSVSTTSQQVANQDDYSQQAVKASAGVAISSQNY